MATSQQAHLFDNYSEKNQGPVNCLGMTFENDIEGEHTPRN